jgi:hypothetical protein
MHMLVNPRQAHRCEQLVVEHPNGSDAEPVSREGNRLDDDIVVGHRAISCKQVREGFGSPFVMLVRLSQQDEQRGRVDQRRQSS